MGKFWNGLSSKKKKKLDCQYAYGEYDLERDMCIIPFQELPDTRGRICNEFLHTSVNTIAILLLVLLLHPVDIAEIYVPRYVWYCPGYIMCTRRNTLTFWLVGKVENYHMGRGGGSWSACMFCRGRVRTMLVRRFSIGSCGRFYWEWRIGEFRVIDT